MKTIIESLLPLDYHFSTKTLVKNDEIENPSTIKSKFVEKYKAKIDFQRTAMKPISKMLKSNGF